MSEFLLNLVPAFVINSVKNPEKKKKLREILLKIFLTIKTAYAGDKDFE